MALFGHATRSDEVRFCPQPAISSGLLMAASARRARRSEFEFLVSGTLLARGAIWQDAIEDRR